MNISSIYCKVVILFFAIFLTKACDMKLGKDNQLSEQQNEGPIVQTEWRSSDDSNEPDVVVEITNLDDDETVPEAQPSEVVQVDGPYQVQIGAFLNETNAQRLTKKLQNEGFPAFLKTSESGGKRWNIVRIGPFNEETSAFAAAEKYSTAKGAEVVVLFNNKLLKTFKVKKQESNQKITQEIQSETTKKRQQKKKAIPSSPKPLVDKSQDQDNKKPFSYQIGGLYAADNAKKFLRKYQKKGYSPYMVEVKDAVTNETWYSVRIGHFDTAKEAVDAAAVFTSKEAIPAQVRPLVY